MCRGLKSEAGAAVIYPLCSTGAKLATFCPRLVHVGRVYCAIVPEVELLICPMTYQYHFETTWSSLSGVMLLSVYDRD